MGLKAIQVPMDAALVAALDGYSQRQGASRSEIIRKACRAYLAQLEDVSLEAQHVEGYLRTPEDPALGVAQMSLLPHVLEREDW